MFLGNTTPKFRCDHCNQPIPGDNECVFYRGQHYHAQCFVRGVEAMKSGLAHVSYPKLPEFKPVNLSAQDPPDLDGA